MIRYLLIAIFFSFTAPTAHAQDHFTCANAPSRAKLLECQQERGERERAERKKYIEETDRLFGSLRAGIAETDESTRRIRESEKKYEQLRQQLEELHRK